MAQRRIVRCDGTWNTPDQHEDGHICPTNVVKMVSAIASLALDGTAQTVLYHDGVGASSGLERSHWTGGAFGGGLSKIIQDAYRFLVDNDTDGAELYFFGCSRGAYARVGVWDMVGALGSPDHILRRRTDHLWECHDVKRSRLVEHAYQALVINAKREAFQPTLWQ
jgi:uncharacterized protein (DUF2235 family)